MFQLIYVGLQAVGGIIRAIIQADKIGDVVTAIVAGWNFLVGRINDLANTMIWGLARVSWQWNNGLHPSFAAGSRLLDDNHPSSTSAFGHIESSLIHIATVIVPNSVKGGTSKNWKGIHAVEKTLTATTHGLRVLNNYVRNTVEPQVVILQEEIRPWLYFQHRWKYTYGPAVGALIDWQHNPIDLSRFLTPTITGTIATALGEKSHRTALDKIERALLGHAPSLVKVIDAAAVNVLSSGSY